MIALHDVTKTYSAARQSAEVTAVHDLNLDVEKGEFLIITGRSGSGKTTLLNLAAALVRPTFGSVSLDGSDLWGLSDRERSRVRSRKLGFVFQFPSLLPTLTVRENVELPISLARDHDATGPTAQGGARAGDLLKMVGLGDKFDAYPRQLSAGQQQRVVIARSLVNSPELLFADEPSSDLDEETELEIMALFKEIHDEGGVTIVMVTHTTQLVGYATRAVEMVAGTIRTP